MSLMYYHKPNYPMVTARSVGRYRDVDAFKQVVDAWLNEHNISVKWEGHGTDTVNGVRSFTYSFSCFNMEDATIAALRWA